MPRLLYARRPVDRITADAVGEPGRRTFYIQARQEDILVTILCEKEQVRALAHSLEELLEEINEKYPRPLGREPDESELQLEGPLEPRFRAGRRGLGYEPREDGVVLVIQELAEDDQDPDRLRVVRFWATREQMHALRRHSAAVVARGRPLCPLCGRPMDPEGHICPRRNGKAVVF